MVRGKNPLVDLRRKYKKTFSICVGISVVLHVLTAVIFPEFRVEAYAKMKDQVVIKIEDIPETRQIQRPPPPPRPSVPIEAESDEVPDDVTIETTELDFDQPVDFGPPPPLDTTVVEAPPEEEEIVPFFKVEKIPEVVRRVQPEYPEIARKAGMEGQVILSLLVGRTGRVEDVQVLKGPEIFQEAAIIAARQFHFKPAIQNDKPVRVWMTVPIRFQLK